MRNVHGPKNYRQLQSKPIANQEVQNENKSVFHKKHKN